MPVIPWWWSSASGDQAGTCGGTAGHDRELSTALWIFGGVAGCLALAFEGCGFLFRLIRLPARTLSMDGVLSVPRLSVAFVFAAAGLTAALRAVSLPERRAWWTAVGLIGGAIAAVKAGGTVHARASSWLSARLGFGPTLLISAAVAAVVITGLGLLNRHERRVRRRVLVSLACYALAAIGLSAISLLVTERFGYWSSWATSATFVEESAEALSGVAFLVAVLASVAPPVIRRPSAAPHHRCPDRHLPQPETIAGEQQVSPTELLYGAQWARGSLRRRRRPRS